MSIQSLILLLFIGLMAGRVSSVWAVALIDESIRAGLRRCVSCKQPFSSLRQLFLWYPGIRCPSCKASDRLWPFWSALVISVMFAGFGWLLLEQGCQSVAEVQPSQPLWQNRLPFHLVFIFLLATATITDYLDYSIFDSVVVRGALLAMIAATLSGELQLIHVWVDWSYDNMPVSSPHDPTVTVPHFGPYLPEWMKGHQHLHGLIWSLSGAVAGAGLMWIARIASRLILGIPAIGFGDVTLMAMIGAFLGWQPTLCALAIAPLVGLILGLGGRIFTGRAFVAFGPYLCIAAYLVLCTWGYLWEGCRLRLVFSHWPTIAGMVSGAFAAFCILLVGLRLFRETPAAKLR